MASPKPEIYMHSLYTALAWLVSAKCSLHSDTFLKLSVVVGQINMIQQKMHEADQLRSSSASLAGPLVMHAAGLHNTCNHLLDTLPFAENMHLPCTSYHSYQFHPSVGRGREPTRREREK